MFQFAKHFPKSTAETPLLVDLSFSSRTRTPALPLELTMAPVETCVSATAIGRRGHVIALT